jgi:hypothetical protein
MSALSVMSPPATETFPSHFDRELSTTEIRPESQQIEYYFASDARFVVEAF